MPSILIVDDSVTIRRLLAHSLHNQAYTLAEASNGQEALSAIAEVSPDVIIVDLHMPDMDGIALIKRIRADKRHKSVPVMLLTTESDALYKKQARAAGATAWMQKPFSDASICGAVRRLLA